MNTDFSKLVKQVVPAADLPEEVEVLLTGLSAQAKAHLEEPMVLTIPFQPVIVCGFCGRFSNHPELLCVIESPKMDATGICDLCAESCWNMCVQALRVAMRKAKQPEVASL